MLAAALAEILALSILGLQAFWREWRPSARAIPANANLIERSMLAHGVRLADSSFYTWRHNHGVDQDIALIQLALTLEGSPAREWYDTGRDRLRGTLEQLIPPAGVMREHSPGYQLTTLRHLRGLSRFVREAGRTDDAELIGATARRMAESLGNFVEPTGYLVPFGDTHGDATPDESLGMSRPGLQALLDDGYAFMRGAVPEGVPERDAWYLAVTAASNRGFAHKHCDDLSFVLTARSRRIVADPGAYSYSADVWRRYFVSCEAHNTISTEAIFQDGVFFPVGTGQAQLETAVDSGEIAAIFGSRSLPEGGMQQRAWVWIPRRGLVVVDLVDAPPGALRQLFHLGEGIRAVIAGDTARLVDEKTGILLARVVRHAPRVAPWQVITGSRTPLQGWISPARGQAIPADVLVASASSRPAVFVTEFILADPLPSGAAPPTLVSSIAQNGTNLAVRVSAGKTEWLVHLRSDGGSPLERVR